MLQKISGTVCVTKRPSAYIEEDKELGLTKIAEPKGVMQVLLQ